MLVLNSPNACIVFQIKIRHGTLDLPLVEQTNVSIVATHRQVLRILFIPTHGGYSCLKLLASSGWYSSHAQVPAFHDSIISAGKKHVGIVRIERRDPHFRRNAGHERMSIPFVFDGERTLVQCARGHFAIRERNSNERIWIRDYLITPIDTQADRRLILDENALIAFPNVLKALRII